MMDLFRKEGDDRAQLQKMTLTGRYRNIAAMLSIAVVALSIFLISIGALIEFFNLRFCQTSFSMTSLCTTSPGS